MGDTHALMIGVDGLFRWQEGIAQCILVYFCLIGGFYFRNGLSVLARFVGDAASSSYSVDLQHQQRTSSLGT